MDAHGERRLAHTGEDQSVPDGDRRDGVLVVGGRERQAPQQFAAVGSKTDAPLLRLRDDLTHAVQRDQDRGRISRAVLSPAPANVAAPGIEGGQFPIVVPAQVRD